MLVIPLSLDVIVEKGLPVGEEMARGFELGLVTRRQIVEIAEYKLRANVEMTVAEERLALLLADELNKVDELVELLAVGSKSVEERDRYWIYIYLALLFEEAEEIEEGLDKVALLWADFGHPVEIRGLVRYLPAEDPGDVGLGALSRRWEVKVNELEQLYRGRFLARGEFDA